MGGCCASVAQGARSTRVGGELHGGATGQNRCRLLRGALDDTQLVARRVGTMRRYLCATPDYLAAAPPLADPADLKKHRCIAFSGLRTGTLWQFSQQRRRRSVRIDPVLSSNDAQAVLDAALAGVGIAMQGDYMADALVAAGRLV